MKSGLWVLGALLVFLIAACSDGPAATSDDTFVVGRSPRVVVSVDTGRIIVNPGSDGRVRGTGDAAETWGDFGVHHGTAQPRIG